MLKARDEMEDGMGTARCLCIHASVHLWIGFDMQELTPAVRLNLFLPKSLVQVE